jgi:hypothetical protein
MGRGNRFQNRFGWTLNIALHRSEDESPSFRAVAAFLFGGSQIRRMPVVFENRIQSGDAEEERPRLPRANGYGNYD